MRLRGFCCKILNKGGLRFLFARKKKLTSNRSLKKTTVKIKTIILYDNIYVANIFVSM